MKGLLFAGALIPVVLSTPAHAVIIDGFDMLGTFNFLDARQTNTAGITAGVRISFGLNVTPVGTQPTPSANGTSVTATQGASTFTVPYLFSPALPNQFFTSISYAANPSLTGPWTLTLTNPSINSGAPATVATPALTTVTPPPFVTDVQLSGGGLTPTISWVRPANYTPSTQTIYIFDKSQPTPTGGATLVLTQGIGAVTSTFNIPSGLLLDNHAYTFAVQLDERVGADLTARSRSFVDFTPIPAGSGQVYLPVVGTDTNPNDDLGAPFTYNIAVSAGVPIAIDPVIAIGYEYIIGEGDPLFASVKLPDIGDADGYLLCLWTGSNYACGSQLDAGELYSFGDGVDRFRVMDIEPGLDPTDGTAFVTTLTFKNDGRFTGTQTPVLREVTEVPEPGTLALALSFLCGWLTLRRRNAYYATAR